MSDGQFQMWRAEGLPAPPTDEPPARNVFQDMARWLRDDSYRSPTLVTAAAARQSVELILALYESARAGQTVTLPAG